jgi:hypothetical protein
MRSSVGTQTTAREIVEEELTMNKQFKVMMLESEKKIYEQVLNNQQSTLRQSEIDELLDLLLEINKQLAELNNDKSR